jgi:acyl-CoA thioesterase FadM
MSGCGCQTPQHLLLVIRMSDARVTRDVFTIRTHDLDRSARLSASAICRILENPRWNALRPDGLVGASAKLGVLRAQSLEIERRVGFGEKIEVSMWLSAVGRTSFTLGYAIRSSADGGIVARSAATFVSTDIEGRPRPVGPGLERVLSDRETIEVPRLDHSPAAGAWSWDLVVRSSDVDLQRHVNQARYVDYIEDARSACARAGGYGAHGQGADAAMRTLAVSYEGQAREGDLLRVFTWALGDAPAHYAFEVRRQADAAPMARALVEVDGP